MAYSRTFGKIGAVVVDMQEKFLREHDSEEIASKIYNQQKILNLFIASSYPILFLEFKNFGRTIPELNKYLCESNCGGNLFIKCTDSGFSNFNFSKTLEKLSLDSLILMGVNASYCVKSTAEDALKNGYNVLISADLINDAKHLKSFSERYLFLINKTNYFLDSSQLLVALKS